MWLATVPDSRCSLIVKRVLFLLIAALPTIGSLAVAMPVMTADAVECVTATAATRTVGTIERVSASRIRVKGSTDSWNPMRGWTPLATGTYRITVQKRQADGTWANVNGVAPGRSWQITGTAGVFRLAYARDCARPFAASSGPAVRIAAPARSKPSTGRRCDPNYAGACVPIASDVDCAGGSGNGPAYVQGPVRVIGRDIYGLDRDGDGIGCE